MHGITVDGDALPDGNDYPIAGWSEVTRDHPRSTIQSPVELGRTSTLDLEIARDCTTANQVRNINIVELAPSVPAAAAVRGFDMEPLKAESRRR